MLREAPRITAQAFDTGDWLHAGLYTLLPGDPVLLFSGAREPTRPRWRRRTPAADGWWPSAGRSRTPRRR